MKGIVLAGGHGTRLRPLTKITCKQLLPVYDKPMIYYPLHTLISSGIKDILIIVAPEYSGQFLNLLGSGKEFGAKFSYAVQDEPRGLPDAFILGEDFLDNDSVTMILGDNIFDEDFSAYVSNFKSGGMVFAKKVPDPQRYGVIEFDAQNNVKSIIEKPKVHISDYAMVGIYILDNKATKFAKNCKPSARGELEIPDVINQYREINELKVGFVKNIWEDAGTFETLLAAGNYWAKKKS